GRIHDSGRGLARPRPTAAGSRGQCDHRGPRRGPAVARGDGTALRAAIAGIEAGCNTQLHAGWREGADTLADVGRLGLRRVILLSDGQAHQGLTDPAAIAAQCAE
ncbi:MAG: hypothetical protein ACK5Y8_19295, partial [Betaproteobacteria bacterium]